MHKSHTVGALNRLYTNSFCLKISKKGVCAPIYSIKGPSHNKALCALYNEIKCQIGKYMLCIK